MPKELDIAVDVFARDAAFTGAEDAIVRVQVRQLRQRLDEYYRGPGLRDPWRMQVPKGAYQLLFEPATAPHPSTAPTPAAAPVSPRGSRSAVAIPWALAALATLALAVVLAGRPEPGVDLTRTDQAITRSAAWAPLIDSPRPVTIVLGDLLLFSEGDGPLGNRRLVRDPRINSRAELQQAVADGTVQAGTTATTLVPKSVAYGLAAVLPLLADGRRDVAVRLLDELAEDDLRTRDIVYVGPLVRAGPIGDLYFARSRYRYDAASMRLRDTRSERWYGYDTESDLTADHGVFASFVAPAGNRIVVLASVARDVGLLQAIRQLTTGAALQDLVDRLPPAIGETKLEFEVLLAARGLNRTDLTAEVVSIDQLAPRTSLAR